MKVGFVQFDPRFGEVDRNLDTAGRLIEEVEADLLVLPELFNTGYLFTSAMEVAALSEEIPGGKTTGFLAELAKRKGVHLLGGLCERDGSRFYNSAVLVSPQGVMGTYRKVHLFFEEKLWFAPGEDGFPVFDIGVCKLGVMICFDWFFPESARVLALKGAQVIGHPANLVLPYCQEAMKTRCLENRVFAVTCNRTGAERRGGKSLSYTGKSQVVDVRSEVLLRAGGEGETTGVVTIDPALADWKVLNAHNDLFKDRRPRFYKDIAGTAS